MARTKHVFPADEIPHLWAHKTQDDARSAGNGNLFFSGDTIYSYGHHFAIARHVDKPDGTGAVLFTMRTYSNTTAKHIRMVSQSIPRGVERFDVFRPEYTIAECYQDLIKVEKLALGALRGATKKSEISTMLNKWEHAHSEEQRYALAFGLDFTPTVLAEGEREAWRAIRMEWEGGAPSRQDAALRGAETRRRNQRAVWEARAVAHAAGAAYRDKPLEERIHAWRTQALPNGIVADSGGALMRLNGDNIQTSKGASVPRDHVAKALPTVLEYVQRGRGFKPNGKTIHLGHYSLDEITTDGDVVAGCHTFKRDEVYNVARLLHVPIPVPEAGYHY